MGSSPQRVSHLSLPAPPAPPVPGVRICPALPVGPGAPCSSTLQRNSMVNAQRLQPERATATCSMSGVLSKSWQQAEREQQKSVKHVGLTPGSSDHQSAQVQMEGPKIDLLGQPWPVSPPPCVLMRRA